MSLAALSDRTCAAIIDFARGSGAGRSRALRQVRGNEERVIGRDDAGGGRWPMRGGSRGAGDAEDHGRRCEADRAEAHIKCLHRGPTKAKQGATQPVGVVLRGPSLGASSADPPWPSGCDGTTRGTLAAGEVRLAQVLRLEAMENDRRGTGALARMRANVVSTRATEPPPRRWAGLLGCFGGESKVSPHCARPCGRE